MRDLLVVVAMRRLLSLALALAACGVDPDTGSGGPGAGADAGVDARVPARDGSVLPPGDGAPHDAIPPDLPPCEAAAYHSDLAWIQAEVFDVSCTTMCHGSPNPGAGMSLLPGQARDHLVDRPSTTHAGWTRVVPGDPGASMLMIQLGGEPGPELEGFMPWGMPRLCEPKIDAIRRWIALGALP